MSVMLSASNCLDWICGITNTSITDTLKNVENYYHKLKNRDAFKKSLPKDINDTLEKIKV